MKKKVLELILVLAVNLIFIGLIEVGFRFYSSSLYEMPLEMKGQRVDDAAKILRPSVHPQGGFRFLSHLDILFKDKEFKTNSLGFRGVEYSKSKKSGVIRVGVIGDSVSSGWGVSTDEVFSKVLESQLIKSCGKEIEVYNFGIPGQSATQEFFVLQEFIDYSFDYVIINYVGNDWVDESVARPRDYFDSPSYAVNFLIVNILSNMGEYRNRQSMEWRPVNQPQDNSINNVLASYQAMAALLRSRNIPALVLMDSRYQSDFRSHDEMEVFLTQLNFKTLNLLRLWHPIPRMSGHEAVRLDDEHNRKYLIPGDYHPNEKWHMDVGKLLGQELFSTICSDQK